jgi:hypothetical protein
MQHNDQFSMEAATPMALLPTRMLIVTGRASLIAWYETLRNPLKITTHNQPTSFVDAS